MYCNLWSSLRGAIKGCSRCTDNGRTYRLQIVGDPMTNITFNNCGQLTRRTRSHLGVSNRRVHFKALRYSWRTASGVSTNNWFDRHCWNQKNERIGVDKQFSDQQRQSTYCSSSVRVRRWPIQLELSWNLIFLNRLYLFWKVSNKFWKSRWKFLLSDLVSVQHSRFKI